jgi:hypothetical protein
MPTQTELDSRCRAFVTYRNDTLGHGAARPDDRYRDDLSQWLPVLGALLRGISTLPDRPLLLITTEDRAQVWMGAEGAVSLPRACFGWKRRKRRWIMRRRETAPCWRWGSRSRCGHCSNSRLTATRRPGVTCS